MASVTATLFCAISVYMILFTPIGLAEPGYKYVESEYYQGLQTVFHWNLAPSQQVGYWINQRGSSHLTGNAQFDAVRASFQTWEDDSASYIDFVFNGMTASDPTFAMQTGGPDGLNVIGWVNMLDNGFNARTATTGNSGGITALHLEQ